MNQAINPYAPPKTEIDKYPYLSKAQGLAKTSSAMYSIISGALFCSAAVVFSRIFPNVPEESQTEIGLALSAACLSTSFTFLRQNRAYMSLYMHRENELTGRNTTYAELVRAENNVPVRHIPPNIMLGCSYISKIASTLGLIDQNHSVLITSASAALAIALISSMLTNAFIQTSIRQHSNQIGR